MAGLGEEVEIVIILGVQPQLGGLGDRVYELSEADEGFGEMLVDAARGIRRRGAERPVLVGLVGGSGLAEQDGGGLLGDLVHLGQSPGDAPPIGDPLLVETSLFGVEAAGGGLAGEDTGPLPVGPVELRRVGLAAAAGLAARYEAVDHATGADEAGRWEKGGQLLEAGLVGAQAACISGCHERQA